MKSIITNYDDISRDLIVGDKIYIKHDIKTLILNINTPKIIKFETSHKVNETIISFSDDISENVISKILNDVISFSDKIIIKSTKYNQRFDNISIPMVLTDCEIDGKIQSNSKILKSNIKTLTIRNTICKIMFCNADVLNVEDSTVSIISSDIKELNNNGKTSLLDSTVVKNNSTTYVSSVNSRNGDDVIDILHHYCSNDNIYLVHRGGIYEILRGGKKNAIKVGSNDKLTRTFLYDKNTDLAKYYTSEYNHQLTCNVKDVIINADDDDLNSYWLFDLKHELFIQLKDKTSKDLFLNRYEAYHDEIFNIDLTPHEYINMLRESNIVINVKNMEVLNKTISEDKFITRVNIGFLHSDYNIDVYQNLIIITHLYNNNVITVIG